MKVKEYSGRIQNLETGKLIDFYKEDVDKW